MVEEYITREAPDIEARKLGLMDAAKALTEKGYTLPDYVLAGLTQEQKDAIALQKAGIGAFQPFLTQAQQAGAFGGSRFGVAQAELGEGLQDARARALAQLNLQNYGQAQAGVQNQLERERALALGIGGLGGQQAQLGQGMASLGAQQQALGAQDVSNLLGIGGFQQQFAQQQADIARQNQLQKIMQPYQQLGFYGDILQGAPTTQQVLSTSQTPPVSPLQSAIGTGIGAISGIAGLRRLGVV